MARASAVVGSGGVIGSQLRGCARVAIGGVGADGDGCMFSVGGGMGWAIVFVATRMWGFGAWAESIR
jgi:hypothetical protein